jgi:hypothetical protein
MYKELIHYHTALTLSPIVAVCKDVKATLDDLTSKIQGRKLISATVGRYELQLCCHLTFIFVQEFNILSLSYVIYF